MIVENQMILVKIKRKTMEWYFNKGYEVNLSDDVFVKAEDLHNTCRKNIFVYCDYCNSIKEIEYATYFNIVQKSSLDKYSCVCCKHKQTSLIAGVNQDNNILVRGDKYYWEYEENRYKELLIYIDKFKYVDNISVNDSILNHAINKYDGTIKKLIENSNLKIENLYRIKPYGYYDNKENLVNDIKEICNKLNRFPSAIEICSGLKISLNQVHKHFTGIKELRVYMGYEDKELIDNRGDYNSSLCELYVANYLIAQGLGESYKREQYPFKKYDIKKRSRSDFTFYIGEIEHHIEVWGAPIGKETSFCISYNEKRVKKEALYKKYNVSFTGIEFSTFQTSYENIEKSLYEIFKNIVKLEHKKIGAEQLKPMSSCSEEDILTLLKGYMSKTGFMPTKKRLYKSEKGIKLYSYIMNKYGGLTYFSNKYNIIMEHKPNNTWDDKLAFEKTVYMAEKYNKFYSSKDNKLNPDKNLIGYYNYVTKSGGRVDFNIRFIEHCLKNNLEIKGFYIEYLNALANSKLNGVSVKDKQQETAREMLNNVKRLKAV